MINNLKRWVYRSNSSSIKSKYVENIKVRFDPIKQDSALKNLYYLFLSPASTRSNGSTNQRCIKFNPIRMQRYSWICFLLRYWFYFWKFRTDMTSTINVLTELKVKKYIPFFVMAKLAIFTGFLFYMMQG